MALIDNIIKSCYNGVAFNEMPFHLYTDRSLHKKRKTTEKNHTQAGVLS